MSIEKNEIIKFNVNLVLDEKSLKLVKDYNKKVCELVDSEIDYSHVIPHITILKYAISPRDAEVVNKIVCENLQNLSFNDLQIKKIQVNGNYILADVENCEEILSVGKHVGALIEKFIVEPPKHPMLMQNKPHITLGWTNETEKAKALFDGEKFTLHIKPVAIRLSKKGAHGTIKGEELRISLKKVNQRNRTNRVFINKTQGADA